MTKTAKTAQPEVLDRVRGLVEEVLAGTPHFIVEFDVRGARGSQAVDVFLDSDDALGVGTLAQISREIGFLLDTEAALPGRYRLNVSSPGVDRPLKLPRQYRKNVGRRLRVHYRKPGGEGYTETLGDLVEADDEAVEVVLSGAERRRIPYDDILWAKVQLPW